MYYSTYYNNKSYYNKEQITNELEHLMSGGIKGLSKPLNFRVKATEKVYTYREQSYFNDALENFLIEVKPILDNLDTDSEYTKFYIPKRSGGRREILAPSEQLKALQSRLIDIFKYDYQVLEHNAAHAYTEGRSIVTNAIVHKNNYNFINIDLTNFFPSITREVINFALYKNAAIGRPYSRLSDELKDVFYKIILYKGALPQGSIASPMISNIVMIPFDYWMHYIIKSKYKNIVYTRYADDLTFSSKPKIFIPSILEIIEHAKRIAYSDLGTFININPKKTRLTTYRGKNRVTGIKVNANNQLSIGYKEKQQLKIDMVSLIISKLNNDHIDSEQLQSTLGMFSYLNSVEPEYAKYLLRKWSRKFNINNIIKFLYNTNGTHNIPIIEGQIISF